MIQYRIDYIRYDSRRGSRSRTDHLMADNISDALSRAQDNCRAWGELDHDIEYRVDAVHTVGSRPTSEATIGWETGEEWQKRTGNVDG